MAIGKSIKFIREKGKLKDNEDIFQVLLPSDV